MVENLYNSKTFHDDFYGLEIGVKPHEQEDLFGE